MKTLRTIDQDGNRQDHNFAHVPRIGERIVLTYGIGGQPVIEHYFRVKDVAHYLEESTDYQVRVLIEEEKQASLWPH